MVETDEMVHVGMGDENVADAQDLAVGQRIEFAQIKE